MLARPTPSLCFRPALFALIDGLADILIKDERLNHLEFQTVVWPVILDEWSDLLQGCPVGE